MSILLACLCSLKLLYIYGVAAAVCEEVVKESIVGLPVVKRMLPKSPNRCVRGATQ